MKQGLIDRWGRERPQRWLVGGAMVTILRLGPLGPCNDGGLAREW